MRLLDTTTRRLKTYYGKQTPKYAILSHTWGTEEDEVLFRHIAGSNFDRREGERRRGYAKVEGACKQAAEDGWKYIWIDTCCIDKESSAELSEAINSMYEWYRNSEVCYVYLEDVQSGDGWPESDRDAVVPFERSRWFSRGWTLQELIAPQYVVFYSRDWIDIGTKASLRDTISAVTRIRVEMLTAHDPREASVAERMSWAAFRETTRAEDVAYCLMGLLGVNMPLLYGEGDKAFRRLQEEIMKVSDDDSLFAWKVHYDNYNRTMHETKGMLADSPWDFRDGMEIVQSNNGAYSPYSMTNQGLQIKLPLLPIDPKSDLIGLDSENIFRTTLKCTIRNRKPTRWIVIYLKMIREGYYQRIFPHWLDETEANPNEIGVNELHSLLIPQVGGFKTHSGSIIDEIEVEILPTESGLTIGYPGRNLMQGYMFPYSIEDGSYEVTFLNLQEKCFGVVIGLDHGVPWLDFVDDIGEPGWGWRLYESYKGVRYSAILRHLDRLCEKIPGKDWWVTVSVRKMGHNQKDSCSRAFIDIHKVPTRTKKWHIPSVMSIGDFAGNFLGNLNHHNIHPKFKKESRDWFAVFNPKIKRVLDISLIHTFLHQSSVYCVQFSHDGKYLATGSDIARVFDVKTGAEICTFIDGPTNTTKSIISHVCFSPDSRFLATGNKGGWIKLWDINEKCMDKISSGHLNSVYSLCFSPDSRLLTSGSVDGAVQIWNIVDGTSRVLASGLEHLDYSVGVRSIAISPNGRFLAAGSLNGAIQIWDILTTRLLQVLQERGGGCIIFTPDGNGLVNAIFDGTLKYWDVSGLIPTEANTEVEYLNYSEASSMLSGRDISTTIRHTMTFTGHKDSVNSIGVSHDRHWIISGSYDDSVLFWDLRNATAQFMLKTISFRSLDASPVDNIFATSDDGRVRIWRYDNI